VGIGTMAEAVGFMRGDAVIVTVQGLLSRL
jgi:hypothetical protein